MASHLIQPRLIIQDQNSNINANKPKFDEKRKISKPTTGKGGAGFGSRKALSDITNKPIIHQEASTKKKNATKEEFNISEEKFLHDHKKCIQSQKTITESCFLDTILPGHDSVAFEFLESKPSKTDLDSSHCYADPVELPMSEFSDWLQSSSPSRLDSTLHWNSPPSSPLAWEFETVEFLLKQENDS